MSGVPPAKNSSERSRQLDGIVFDRDLTHEREFQHKTIDCQLPRRGGIVSMCPEYDADHDDYRRHDP